jgi:putative ABC transport system substrate-binding protein
MKNLPRSFFLLLVLLAAVPSFAEIALVKTGTSYDDARNGFSSICFENKKEFTLVDDLSNQSQIADEIKAGNYSMVVALGPQAATFAKSSFSALPLVYALVVTPDKVGMKGENITGVALDVPMLEQFTILRNINKKIKRIGVIYTQSVNDQLIVTAREIALGLDMSLVTSPITNSQDIQRAMSELLGKCDALWIPPDPSLSSDDVIKYIGSTSLSKQLPCVGPNERFVRAGAILSFSSDSVEAGKNAGDLANKILAGTPPAKLPIIELKRPKVIINLKAAGLLGLTIPKNVQNAASKIYQ